MHWTGWVAAGVVWVGVVVAALVFSLELAAGAAADGVISEPSAAQVTVAWLSGAVFSVPGFAFIVVGVRRWRRRHSG